VQVETKPMMVTKKKFSVDSFYFENADRSIPVDIGYETYGELNSTKDNVILICHYFTGTSHIAGKYAESDAAAGWWDRIVGSGKIIDTDKFFVIAVDSISNINHYNPNVITTGPATINPQTGKPYAMDFPIFTLKDNVRLQKMLLDQLGIKKLRYVMGPSMGGLQAFMWGKFYPEMTEKIISVVATPMLRPYGIMIPNQMGIYSIMLDPKWNNGNYYGQELPHEGLLLGFKVLLLSTRTDDWFEVNFGRKYSDPNFMEYGNPFKSFDGRFLVETEVEKIVLGRMEHFDANAYIYIAKANALFDLREGEETQEEAWSKIKAPVLMVIDDSDMLFTGEQAEQAMKYLPNAKTYYYNSKAGHLSCLFNIDLFENAIGEFIRKS
jgi:homoserine O-acetyltransferase/O-succinyltransferase